MKRHILLIVFPVLVFLNSLEAEFNIDTESRWQVRDFYNTVFPFGSNISMEWTGDYNSGDSGTVSSEWQEATLTRINFYRAMAGVPANVTFDDTLSAKSQDSALIMSGNKTLNHFPPPEWPYYTADGREAAENGNLALGSAGRNAIEGFMIDFGADNEEVGHRRWLLYPQTSIMGSGDVPGIPGTDILPANTVYVITDEYFDPRPVTREDFVAWPPAGHVPSRLVYARWSFAVPEANFGSATVTMERDGEPLSVVLEPIATGIGEPAIVWVANDMQTDEREEWPAPVGDEEITVNIANVFVDGQARSYTYTVSIFDAARPGSLEFPSEPVPFGPIIVGHPTYFSTTSRPWSEGIGVRQFSGSPLNGTFGGENGEIPFIVNISDGYELLQDGRTSSGSSAYRLAHPAGREAQTLEWENELFVSGPSPEMTFQSSLSFATPDQYCAVDVSLGSGDSWTEVAIIHQGGADYNTSFENKSVDLSGWLGYTIRIRFRYDLINASQVSWNPGVRDIDGWAIDDIAFTGVEEVTDLENFEPFPGQTGFPYLTDDPDSVYLQTRDFAFDGFALDWGPAHPISPVLPASILSAGNQWEEDIVFGFHREFTPEWKYVTNMGWVHRDAFPWIHTKHGWMYYVMGTLADGLWLYHNSEGFLFTRADYEGDFLKAPFGSSDWAFGG